MEREGGREGGRERDEEGRKEKEGSQTDDTSKFCKGTKRDVTSENKQKSQLKPLSLQVPRTGCPGVAKHPDQAP